MNENVVYEERKERISDTPYIVSADIKLLLAPWVAERGFVLPGDEFFGGLRQDFSERMTRIFPGFELVGEEEMRQGLGQLVKAAQIFPVALDRVYFDSPFQLDITRTIDAQGTNTGLARRAESPMLLSQFRQLRNFGIKEVALVDDVIFSGDLLLRVSGILESMDVSVPYIFAGVGIGEGIDKLKANGKEVYCVREYPEVIDEICERDFYPGVPMSGRLVDAERNMGAPYILPFGDPVGWASIPQESQVSFSQFAREQTAQLFQAIEKASGRRVTCADIGRKVIGMPQDNTRFVEALAKV